MRKVFKRLFTECVGCCGVVIRWEKSNLVLAALGQAATSGNIKSVFNLEKDDKTFLSCR